MINLEDEIKELKQSFDDCDFGGGETKRMFEIIEQLQKEFKRYEYYVRYFAGKDNVNDIRIAMEKRELD